MGGYEKVLRCKRGAQTYFQHEWGVAMKYIFSLERGGGGCHKKFKIFLKKIRGCNIFFLYFENLCWCFVLR